MTENKLWNADFIKVFIASIANFCSFFMLASTIPLFVTITLKEPTSVAGLIVGLFGIGSLVSRQFAGMVIDRFGRKKILVSLMFAMFFSTLLYYLADASSIFYPIRILHGLIWGFFTTSINTTAIDFIPPKRLGEGIGYFGSGSYVAMAIGPLIGLTLFAHYDWIMIIHVATVFSFLALVLILSITSRDESLVEKRKIKFELNSMILTKALPLNFMVIIVLFSFGLIEGFIAIYAKSINIENIGVFFVLMALGVGVSRAKSGDYLNRGKYSTLLYISLTLLSLAFAILYFTDSRLGLYVAAFIMGIGNGLFIPSMQTMTIRLATKDQMGIANSTFYTSFDLGIGCGILVTGFLLNSISFKVLFLTVIGIYIFAFLYYNLIYIRFFKENISSEKL